MLTFHPLVKLFIYLLTIAVSSFIGNQLTNALCIDNCLFQKILYIGLCNLVFLLGIVLLIGLSEKSISEWNEEE
jgi:hypothetical protein